MQLYLRYILSALRARRVYGQDVVHGGGKVRIEYQSMLLYGVQMRKKSSGGNREGPHMHDRSPIKPRLFEYWVLS